MVGYFKVLEFVTFGGVRLQRLLPTGSSFQPSNHASGASDAGEEVACEVPKS